MYAWSRKRGAPKDQEVARVQSALGIDSDGLFGPATEAAVKQYQSDVLGVDRKYIDQPMMQSLGMPVHMGIDVSAYQLDTDWKAVASAGVKFMWRKATEGQTHVNSERGDDPGDGIAFARDAVRAQNQGILTGFYHFGRPDTGSSNPEKDAHAEAGHFLRWVFSDLSDLPPVVDLEKGRKNDPNYNAKWLVRFCDIVEQSFHRRCVIYTASWAYDLYLKGADPALIEYIKRRPLWLADYDGKPDNETRIWDEYSVHQFTGTGSIPGVKGNCDVNWSAGGWIERLTGCAE